MVISRENPDEQCTSSPPPELCDTPSEETSENKIHLYQVEPTHLENGGFEEEADISGVKSDTEKNSGNASSTKRKLIASLDIGTTIVRCFIFDDKANVCASSKQKVSVRVQ